ncbi:MAG: GDSL-type esterase/lipase family protein [Opitutaceae bacterium]|nr:GDSL-type esterase/lipase family protein [Opitutaceae bacterium]
MPASILTVPRFPRFISAARALALLLCGAMPGAGAGAPPPEFSARDGLPNARAKALAGGEVRVAFLGGSITAANGWRVHTLEILRGAFPKAAFTEIYAAVSGTGSNYGAARLRRDVLRHKPDLLFVEFAVNDGGQRAGAIIAQMEGIVRQTWAASPGADICFVYTVSAGMFERIKAGEHPPSSAAMEKVAAHYGIPSVQFGVEVARRDAAGTLVFHAPASVKAGADGNDAQGRLIFTRDKTHPTDAGHRVYAFTLKRALPALLQTGAAGPHDLPAPLAADNWQRAQLVTIPDSAATGAAATAGDATTATAAAAAGTTTAAATATTAAGTTTAAAGTSSAAVHAAAAWRKLAPRDTVAAEAGSMAPPIWVALTPGAAAEFRFKGTRIGIIGLKGADNGQFRCFIDGRPAATSTLFDSYSTPGRHPLKPWFFPDALPDAGHTVRIELLAEKIDKAAIMKKAGINIADPTPDAVTSAGAGAYAYDGHMLYLCGFLIVGDPLSAPILTGPAPTH